MVGLGRLTLRRSLLFIYGGDEGPGNVSIKDPWRGPGRWFWGTGWRREAGGLARFSLRWRRLGWVNLGGGVGIIESVRRRVPLNEI